jgi:site-specific DNA-cytosine methylase
VRGIKGKGSGFLHTPTATEIGMRSPAAMEKRKKYRESIGRKTVPPGNLLEQLQMMYPTPAARDHKDSTISKSHQNRNSDSLPITIMKMYGTPKAQDNRAALWDRGKGNLGEQVHGENNARATGGRLNPNFVEFLMGYPMTLDKDRANRIKSLGNSIVPQIARQLGLAIMKAELNETR